jgi:hypothetical protein
VALRREWASQLVGAGVPPVGNSVVIGSASKTRVICHWKSGCYELSCVSLAKLATFHHRYNGALKPFLCVFPPTRNPEEPKKQAQTEANLTGSSELCTYGSWAVTSW